MRVIGRQAKPESDLIVFVVLEREPVIDKKSRVALSAVRVVDLLAAHDWFEGGDRESLAEIVECPARFSRSLVVQHVRHRH